MKNKKIITFSIALVGALIMLNVLVNAIGVSSNYNSEYPVTVYPGETKEVFVSLKSSSDDGDLKIKAEMIDNAGIAELSDSNQEYSVSPGISGEAKVNIRISSPTDAVTGRVYEVKLRFLDVTPSSKSGTVIFSTSAETTLPVKVVEKPVTPTTETPQEEGIGAGWIILGIVVIIALIIIIYFIIKSRKK